jgi:hypothetical protein
MSLRKGDANAIQLLHLALGTRKFRPRLTLPLGQLNVGNGGIHRIAD